MFLRHLEIHAILSSGRIFEHFLLLYKNVADEITDGFDLVGLRNLDADEFIFNQYHQLEAIEPIDPEIVAQARFICNSSDINTQILGNDSTHLVSIKDPLRRKLTC